MFVELAPATQIPGQKVGPGNTELFPSATATYPSADKPTYHPLSVNLITGLYAAC